MHPTNSPARVLPLLAILFYAVSAPAQVKDAGDPAQPRPITLKFDNAPQKAVFEELGKQAEHSFTTSPANLWEKSPGPAISVDVNAQPFWVAMKDACGKAGLSLIYTTDSPELKVILRRDNQDWTKFPSVATGPFLVNLMHLKRESFVNMNKPKDVERSFTVRFTVFCEPRFRMLRGPLAAKVEEATDDQGRSLIPKPAAAAAPPQGSAEPALNFVTNWAYNLDARLEYPATPAGKISKLRASARFVVQTKSETIEFADPLAIKDAAKTVGGRRVTIREVKRGAEEYEAHVTLGRGDVPAAQWEQTVFPGTTLRLVDAAGKVNVAHGFGLGGKGDESKYVFRFEKEPQAGSRIGKPVKLVWEVPTETKEVPLTFEFTDLPVP